jgi:hypothetical protein
MQVFVVSDPDSVYLHDGAESTRACSVPGGYGRPPLLGDKRGFVRAHITACDADDNQVERDADEGDDLGEKSAGQRTGSTVGEHARPPRPDTRPRSGTGTRRARARMPAPWPGPTPGIRAWTCGERSAPRTNAGARSIARPSTSCSRSTLVLASADMRTRRCARLACCQRLHRHCQGHGDNRRLVKRPQR